MGYVKDIEVTTYIGGDKGDKGCQEKHGSEG